MNEKKNRSKRKTTKDSYQGKSGKFKRGNPGRPKGKKDKFTDLKKAFHDVFEKIEKEGQKKNSKTKTLFEWATKNDKNQGMFYQMISKMLPSNVDVEVSGQLPVIISDKYLPKEDNGRDKPE
jgi:hypothetical protein